MSFTLTGLLMLAFADNYLLILLAVSIVGFGSSVFHPTASRVAQLASGRQKSLAHHLPKWGGNGGSALGPLLAAIIILPFGQHAISWFAIAALLAAIIMVRLGAWYGTACLFSEASAKRQPDSTPISQAYQIRSVGHSHPARILQVPLHLVHHELFHVLPHRQVRHHGAGITDMPFQCSLQPSP